MSHGYIFGPVVGVGLFVGLSVALLIGLFIVARAERAERSAP